MSDDREDEWLSHQLGCLRQGNCPHSGLPLHRDGEGLPGTMSCDMCDCFGFEPSRVRPLERILFTLCRHCNQAISLNPAKFFTDYAGNFRTPDWGGERYWCHFRLVADNHLPEPKSAFVDHLWPIPAGLGFGERQGETT